MTGQQESQSERIVRMLGGRQRSSEITGLPATSIQSWLKTGRVPQDLWADIVVKANEAGLHDFNIHHFIAHMVTMIEARRTEQRG